MLTRPLRRRRILFEKLELRRLLASSLTYTGTSNADDYLLRPKTGSPGTIEVLLNGSVIDTQTASNVASMTFNTLGGNDTLTVTTSSTPIIFNGGTTSTDHDVLNLQAGSYTFNSDAITTAAHLTISLSGASLTTTTSQHLEALNIAATGSFTTAAGGLCTLYLDNLSIAPTGKLDLNDDSIAVAYAASSPFTTIQDQIISGFSDTPDSSKSGIISTTSQNSGGTTILAVFDNGIMNLQQEWLPNTGSTVAAHTVLGKTVPMGDLNFDGMVTADDYGTIDANFGSTPQAGLGYVSGDTNFDGTVTADDYGAIDANFGAREQVKPAVTLTNPAGGATLSASASFSANAMDGNGIASVSFLVDGNPVGTPDGTYPFSLPVDTTLYANGTHQVTAIATDYAGNTTTSAPVNVAISNAGAAAVGQWSSVMSFPIVAMNMVLMDTGKILMWDGGPDCLGGISGQVYDPVTNTFTADPAEAQQEFRDIFCSAQTAMPDGRILIVGGHECVTPGFVGTNISDLFDPATQTWTHGPNMTYRRWYPSVITMGNGKQLIVAGSSTGNTDYDPIPEVYDPATNTFTTLNSASQVIPNYNFLFQLPDGRVFVAGSDEAKMASYVLNVATQQWSVVDPTILDAGSAVMYAPGKILKAGSSYLSPPADNGGDVPSSANSYVIDMNQPNATWQQVQSMAHPRTHLNMTVLPDGTVLTTGGSNVIGGITAAQGVLPSELWNPVTQTWSTMASLGRSRVYHSTALLLPDGRVLVAGSGHNYANSYAEFSGEIYSPPYLFHGARPTITSNPGTAAYGSQFFVGTPDASDIQSVSIIRDGSVTHSFNMDQRRVPLNFHVTAGGLTVDMPSNNNEAPPGYYMLFIVNKNGVPSVAPLLKIAADTQAPTAPTNVTGAAVPGKVTLNWSPSTDNVGVTGYDVYRSTVDNFTISPSNRIATTSALSYIDTTVGTGTYYYKITASDLAGNMSAPSTQVQVAVPVTIQMVQHAATGAEGSTGHSMSLAFPSANIAGDFLIVTGTAARPAQTMTISDTAGDTFVQAVGPVTDPAQDVTAYIWYVPVAKGGANTVTIIPTDSAGHALEIHISEWNGVNAANPLDQISSATGAGTLITSGSMTTTSSGDLVFGYAFPQQNATAGAGFTSLSFIDGDLDEYQVQTAVGPIAATFTQNSDNWLALGATFRPAFDDTVPPSAPANLVATGAIGEASLTWNASSDNVAVIGYRVYRSATPNFTPAPANFLATASNTSYTDDGAPGTWYYRVTAIDAASNESASSNEASATITADTTAPQVSITQPGSGTTVSGVITLAANASDDVGVAGVQFFLDGSTLGAEDTTSPYSISWTSTTVANGTHILTARARDAAGNMTTSDFVSFVVNNVAPAGLVGEWGFNEDTGTITADASGHNLGGTLSNTTWTTGHSGSALSFNGTNSWVTVADNSLLHLTNAMTLEAWVKPAAGADWSNILLKERTGGMSYGMYAFDGANAPPGVWFNKSSGDVSAEAPNPITLGSWTHIAGTYDGANLRLYINGALVQTTAVTGTMTAGTGALRIGGDSIWGEYFNGVIDDVRIYNRALSASEIAGDMNSPVT